MDYPESQGDFNREIMRRMAEIERQQSQFFSKYPVQVGHQRNPRLAKTIADATATPTYPIQGVGGGNTFPIVFLSSGFTNSAGRKTPSDTAHDTTPQALAFILSRNWLPQSTVIQVWQDIGVDSTYKGQWWSSYTDGIRMGLTSAGIAKNAYGNVSEREPNDYGSETTPSRTWVCKNWCGYDLLTNTRVFFQQIGSVAYIINAECDPE